MSELLDFDIYGEPSDQPTLLIAHGLFGSARNWRALGRRFASDRQVIAVNMRNHGASFWRDSNTYLDMADDLANVIRAQSAPCDVLGHSMGGKAAMVLAVQHAEYVNRLIVADIAPVGYQHSHQGHIQAMLNLDLNQVDRRSDADTQLAVLVREDDVRQFLLQNLNMTATPPNWHLNLKALEANMAAIIGFPDVTGSFENKCLFVTGGQSEYVRTEHHLRIRNLFPASKIQTIPKVGHWLHAENPRAFIDHVAAFLAE